MFDAHPCDARSRVRAAEAAAAAGVLVGADGRRRHSSFETSIVLSAAATRHHFEHDLGLSVASLALLDTHDAISDIRIREESLTAVERFFGDRFSPWRPLRLSTRRARGAQPR